MTGYLFVYPVILCVGAGSSINEKYGLFLSLFLSTLIAIVARIEICRFLIKNQGLQQEPRVKFWSSSINCILAFLLFMSLACFLGTNFRPSSEQPLTLFVPCLVLIIPIFLYKIAGFLRKHFQKKYLQREFMKKIEPEESA